ncbi:hypothetical protein [Novosphingobium sp.]|uniref:hypothetical protein n=1 Tax=Novosphingobium sp. TaxID=1874826 RepID=UPI002736A8EF|nr:hypothetical protein [Novosphingobium sp.]MDP3908275.1 hypothetical protein [Novosphingobium sp.]
MKRLKTPLLLLRKSPPTPLPTLRLLPPTLLLPPPTLPPLLALLVKPLLRPLKALLMPLPTLLRTLPRRCNLRRTAQESGRGGETFRAPFLCPPQPQPFFPPTALDLFNRAIKRSGRLQVEGERRICPDYQIIL